MVAMTRDVFAMSRFDPARPVATPEAVADLCLLPPAADIPSQMLTAAWASPRTRNDARDLRKQPDHGTAHSYFFSFPNVGKVTVTFGFPKLACTARM